MKNNCSFLNRVLFITLYISGLMVFILSCDKIEPPYTVNNEVIDTAKCPVPVFPVLSNVTKKILIEDFTGHKCGNCPRAHKILKDLIATYGDTVIGVSLHVNDYYASPDTFGLFTYDFRTSEGTEIDNFFSISNSWGLPQGMINRTKYGNSVVISPNSWPTVVQSMLTNQAKIGMQIINNYNNADNSFCTHIKITYLENITDTLMFFCGLKEDSILKPQKNYDSIPNDLPVYIHMHAFRDGLNGSLGVTINPQTTLKDSFLIKSYYYNLNGKDYVHKNLKVFAYVYKFSNNEVMQAEEKAVIQ